MLVYLSTHTIIDRIWNYIESGKAEGAKVLLGGEKRSSRGYWVDPTSESDASIILRWWIDLSLQSSLT